MNTFILAPVVTGCVSIPTFASLVGIHIEILSSSVGTKINSITTEIKKFKSLITKKKKKHDKIVWVAKTELNTLEVLISRT